MSTTSIVIRADLRREFQRPAMLTALILISAGSLVALQLALGGSGRPAPAVAAGATWIVLLYGAVLAAARVVSADRDGGTWDALLLARGDRARLAVAKVASALTIMVPIHLAVLVLAWGILAEPRGISHALTAAASVLLADIAFAAIGVLAGFVAMRARARELLVPIIMLPLTIPALIAGVSVMASTVAPDFEASWATHLGFLALYALTFVVILLGSAEELAVE